MLAKVEARLVPPPRKCLSAIIDDIDRRDTRRPTLDDEVNVGYQ
jgi:hypothetical protein